MPAKPPGRKTVTVWTPSHMKNGSRPPLTFKGVKRVAWGAGYAGSVDGDLVLNPAHVVAVTIEEEPDASAG